MFENNRVKFYMQTEVSELRAQEGKVGFSLLLLLLLLVLLLLLLPVSLPVLRNCARLLTHSLPQLQEVVLKSSKVLRADVCVVGIGE